MNKFLKYIFSSLSFIILSGCTSILINNDQYLNKTCHKLEDIANVWEKTEKIYQNKSLELIESGYICTNSEYENLCYKIIEKDSDIDFDIIFKGSDKLFHFINLDFLGNYDTFYYKNFIEQKKEIINLINHNIKKKKHFNITIYGHSLGGAFAYLLLKDLYSINNYSIPTNYSTKDTSIMFNLKTWNMINLNKIDQDFLINIMNNNKIWRTELFLNYDIVNYSQKTDITHLSFTNIKNIFHGNKVEYTPILDTKDIFHIIYGHSSINLNKTQFQCNLIIEGLSGPPDNELRLLFDNMKEGEEKYLLLNLRDHIFIGDTKNNEYKEDKKKSIHLWGVTLKKHKNAYFIYY